MSVYPWNQYPWSDIVSGSLFERLMGILAVVFCVLFTLWMGKRQNGSSLSRATNELTKEATKTAKCNIGNHGLSDTASALLSKADTISPDTYLESQNEATAFVSTDSHRSTRGIVANNVGQSQPTSGEEPQSIRGRTDCGCLFVWVGGSRPRGGPTLLISFDKLRAGGEDGQIPLHRERRRSGAAFR